jgi:hypothetical protein
MEIIRFTTVVDRDQVIRPPSGVTLPASGRGRATMGIAKKYRRRLVIGERLFLWWVREIQPEDWIGPVLTIASDDKRFLVRYYLGQNEEQRFLVVLGPEFPGLPDAGGCWIRVRCPQWEAGSSIKPSDVRRLIDWCLFGARQLERVDWRGHLLPCEEPPNNSLEQPGQPNDLHVR